MHSGFALAFFLRIIAQTCVFVSEILKNKNNMLHGQRCRFRRERQRSHKKCYVKECGLEIVRVSLFSSLTVQISHCASLANLFVCAAYCNGKQFQENCIWHPSSQSCPWTAHALWVHEWCKGCSWNNNQIFDMAMAVCTWFRCCPEWRKLVFLVAERWCVSWETGVSGNACFPGRALVSSLSNLHLQSVLSHWDAQPGAQTCLPMLVCPSACFRRLK